MRLCWRHLTTAVTHNGFAFGIHVSANCFHPVLLFVYLIQEGHVLPREIPNNLNSSMGGWWTPPNQLFPQSNVLVTSSSILLVPQAKNLGSPPPPRPPWSTPLGEILLAPSSAQNPILQEPAPPSWPKPPSSLTEILKTDSYCPSGSCPCPITWWSDELF